MSNIPSIPPYFLDANILRNSRQFKLVRGILVWKNEEGDEINEELAQDLEDIEHIRTHRLEGVQIEEEIPQE